jgi:hypothetical protein
MDTLAHKREISMRTFKLGRHAVLVEGSLIDRRYPPGRKGVPQTPELIHHIIVKWKVKGPEMRIEHSSAEMPHYPNEECPAIFHVIRNLEGLQIVPGFTMKVKKTIGGARGCAHLTNLVLAMAEEAIQGYWAAYIEERRKNGLSEEEVKNFINTCHLWKEGGPILKRMKEERNKIRNPKLGTRNKFK